MGKIRLVANLISNEETLNIDTTGLQVSDKIIYKENDITVAIIKKSNTIEMVRQGRNYIINLVFIEGKKTYSKYEDLELLKSFDIETYTKELFISENLIKINYTINNSDFMYELNIGG